MSRSSDWIDMNSLLAVFFALANCSMLGYDGCLKVPTSISVNARYF
jgi:hypothetical protein